LGVDSWRIIGYVCLAEVNDLFDFCFDFWLEISDACLLSLPPSFLLKNDLDDYWWWMFF
jgi:hypothetical protein